jgi:cbb3-type cytochrome oxidase subunit 1
MSTLCLQELSIMDSADALDDELTQWWLGHDSVDFSHAASSTALYLAVVLCAASKKETMEWSA